MAPRNDKAKAQALPQPELEATVEGQAEAATEPEPETVTLYGILRSITDNKLMFLVDYNDGEGTVTEFAIPREQVVSLFDEDTACEQNELVVTVAYAVEAGIIEDPSLIEEDNDDLEPGASTVPNDSHWLQQETITVTQELTQKEKAEYADVMAQLDKEVSDLEYERDSTSRALKKKIDAKEEERRQLSKLVREGRAEREIFCDKVADYNSCEIVWTDAHGDHEIVQRRKMTDEERKLPLIKKTKPDQASPAQQEAAEEPAEADGLDFDALAELAASEGDAFTVDAGAESGEEFSNYTPTEDQNVSTETVQ